MLRASFFGRDRMMGSFARRLGVGATGLSAGRDPLGRSALPLCRSRPASAPSSIARLARACQRSQRCVIV
eukprot:6967873-Pyramimonas_sp.AAC.1